MAACIGIIGAMQVEVDLLLAHLEQARATTVSGSVFYEGTIEGVPVVIVRCGVGKVNAAMICQTTIDRFGATHIINTGIAGGLDRRLKVGDLVISSDAVQHDMDVTGLGYTPGTVPELEEHGKLSFAADEHLRAVVRQAVAEVAPELTVIEGRVASGDQFVSDTETWRRVVAQFGAACCEMEGAAIAQVAWRNDVPFVIVRTISDNADETSTTEYRDAEAETARACAAITLRAIELLGAEGSTGNPV